METIIKIALCIVCFFIYMKHEQEKKKRLLAAGVCILVFLASPIMTKMLTYTETITVQALSQKNESAGNDEILVAGVTVGDDFHTMRKPVEGKWFLVWNDYYMWRSEQDGRRPDGVTNEVQFSIPVGRDRKITFITDEWKGKVQIECLGEKQIVDTYSATSGSVDVLLPSSSIQTLVFQMALRIVLFAAVLLAAFKVISSSLFVKMTKKWIGGRYYCLINAAILLITLFVMITFSSRDSLWNDEVYQIGYSLTPYGDTLYQLFIAHDLYYPSLGDAVLSLWYNITPFGEKWLLLPLEIATVAGIYVLSLTVKKLYGERASILATMLGATNTNLLFQGGYEFRSYGFLFLFCSLALYVYTDLRANDDISWKKVIVMAIALWLPASLHIYGMFFSTGLVLTDFVLMIVKRLGVKWFASYIITGLLYLPWIYNMICFGATSFAATWQITPSLSALNSLVNYLSGWNAMFLFLMILGAVLTFINVIVRIYNGREINPSEIAPLVSWGFTIAFVYLYGTFVNPDATMWMERYFVGVFVCTILYAAFAADELCKIFSKKELALAVCITVSCTNGVRMAQTLSNQSPTGYEHFREAADWLYSQVNTIYNDTTLTLYTPDALLCGWEDFYLTRKGLRDKIDVISVYEKELTSEDLAGKELVYVYYEHMGLSEAVDAKLFENGFEKTADDDYLKICTYERRDQSNTIMKE